MFSLIRRRSGTLDDGSTEAAFESTMVSLSTAVPRPAERRSDERMSAMLRVGKLTMASGEQQLVKVKNLSAGGLMAIVTQVPEINDQVAIELSSQKIPATIVWTRNDTVGLKFDQSVDLGELLAGRKPRHGFRARPPRLDIACKASVRVGKLYYRRRRARHFARWNEGRTDRGILRRQEGDRGRREPATDQGRGSLVFRPQGRDRIRSAARVRRACRMGRQTPRTCES